MILENRLTGVSSNGVQVLQCWCDVERTGSDHEKGQRRDTACVGREMSRILNFGGWKAAAPS